MRAARLSHRLLTLCLTLLMSIPMLTCLNWADSSSLLSPLTQPQGLDNPDSFSAPSPAQSSIQPSYSSSYTSGVPQTASIPNQCTPIRESDRGGQFNWRQYTLGAQDKIQIEILGFEKLGQKNIIIPPNGTLILDLIGPIQASNITLEDFHANLVKAYSEYLVEPKISVNLLQTKTFLVYINGAVQNPGSYEISTTDDNRFGLVNVVPGISINRTSPLLSNMLVAAGGILYDADLEHVKITNEENNQCLEVNLISLLQKQDNMQDVHLIPGDTIVIPRLDSPILVDENKYKLYASSSFSPDTIPVKVVGYVNSPGLVELEPAQSRNLLSAIASAGGYLRDSAYFPKEVMILRHSDRNGKLTRFEVDPRKNDVALHPNDIVYVPIKRIPRAGLFFDYLARVLAPFNVFANSYRNLTGDTVFQDNLF